MASIRLTPRDVDLLSALDRCPLTVRQLLALSVTFERPFRSVRRLQDRLAILAEAGMIRRFRYADTEHPGQLYCTLAPEAIRLLHGTEAFASPGVSREIGIARHRHTRKLADFVVHTLVAAHRLSLEVVDFSRENTLRLELDANHLYPDGAFTLALPDGRRFRYFLELDNSTEPLVGPKERDSWLHKLRFYEKLQDHSDERFRVLAVSTRSARRIDNLLTLAASVATNSQRALLYGVYLPTYLESTNPLGEPLFKDHRHLCVALLPPTLPLENRNADARVESLAIA